MWPLLLDRHRGRGPPDHGPPPYGGGYGPPQYEMPGYGPPRRRYGRPPDWQRDDEMLWEPKCVRATDLMG